MIRPILQYPEFPLLQICTPITFDESFDLEQLIIEMFETMYLKKGIGLAANQIGINRTLAVIDVGLGPLYKLTLVNPFIVDRSDEYKVTEGCLSLPGKFFELKRFKNVTVEFQDIRGRSLIKSYTGLLAQAIQHEVHHLQGRLINEGTCRGSK
jgi:peptide deformylase